MKLVVLLPSYAEEPVGGFRIAYEYASWMAARGHRVTILHPGAISRPTNLLERVQMVRWWVRRHIRRKRFAPWFAFPPGVKFRLIPWYEPSRLPKADATMATAWRTAYVLAQGGSRCGRGYYLIQHFEDWSGDPEEILESYRLPLQKFAISHWLQNLIGDLGETSEYLPNRLALDGFGIDEPVASRDPVSILFLAHELSWKGTSDALETIRLLRKRFPNLRPRAFGTRSLPGFPEDIPFELAPHGTRLRAIYNQAAIFLAPSHSEGWGLPPCEAMTCGCAVVATDIDGHREFAIHEGNVLLVPPKDPSAMAQAVERLVVDAALRERLGSRGGDSLAGFRTDASWKRFEQILTEDALV